MKGNILLVLILLSAMVTSSCAKRRAAPTVPQTTETEQETSLEFLDSFEEDELFAIESSPALSDDEFAPNSMSSYTGDGDYTVVAGDTLMYIAYKLYGDYQKWPSIARMNGLAGSSALQAGSVLKIDSSMVRSLPRVEGRTYIIKVGDSLSKISMQEYGNFNQWKPLWEHNSHMIKDPNIIFAGFQMHLLPDGQLAFNR
jgi:nucleoid-associated protein YgaU